MKSCQWQCACEACARFVREHESGEAKLAVAVDAAQEWCGKFFDMLKERDELLAMLKRAIRNMRDQNIFCADVKGCGTELCSYCLPEEAEALVRRLEGG